MKSVLEKVNQLISSTRTPSSSSVGICRGIIAGHLGVWAKLRNDQSELYRVILSCEGETKTGKKLSDQFSYTFAPALRGRFFQSIEMPRTFKEFLVGKNPAISGKVSFEFIGSEGKTTSVMELRPVLRCYRLKGKSVPSGLPENPCWLSVDSAEMAALKETELKAYSDKVKAELEEKRKQEEAERKAKEEAAKKAAEEAAKAAAAKAAAASAKPAASAAAAGVAIDRSQPTLQAGRVLVVYGSSTGNTKNVAESIKSEMGEAVDHVKNITEIHPADLANFEKVIVGVPTWHIGEIQEDWGAVLPEIEALNFAGKKVAVFGLGDGKGYPETYVDAMAELVEKFEKKGAKLVGMWPTDGYDFKKSKAVRDGKFLGLVIDVENQDHLSDKRVKAWVAQLQKEFLG